MHDENARFLNGISGNAGVFMPLEDGNRFASMLGRMGEGFHLAGTPECFFSDRVPDHCFGHTGFTGTSLIVEPKTGFWVLLLSNHVYPSQESTVLFTFAGSYTPRRGSSFQGRKPDDRISLRPA